MPVKRNSLPHPSYKRTIDYLYGMKRFGIRMNLKGIKTVLHLLDDPQRAFPSVHVGGSNGKGSTSAMLESILKCAGYRVGLYTSPHLIRFNERIRVDKREIPNRKVVELVDRIDSRLKAGGSRRINLTFFEFATAMAFLYFAECDVDIAIVEVGMGGRLDATNVVRSIVSIITNVSREHEIVLGKGIRSIAQEKGGIIKKGVPLVTSARGVALEVLKEICGGRGTPIHVLGKDFQIELNSKNFDFLSRWYNRKCLRTNLEGSYQLFNAACALGAVELLRDMQFSIDDIAIREGLARVKWPGRFETVQRRPTVIIDCAHNPAGADALREAITTIGFRRLFLILGIMDDKDIRGIVSRFAPLAHKIFITMPKTERAASIKTLKRYIKPYSKTVVSIKDIAEACNAAISNASNDDLVCITGSIFTAGEARKILISKGALA
jgi:dihydrofolate synthase/folylpolyglutamate synthase